MRSRTFVMRQVRASVWMVTKLPSRGDGVAWGRWGGGIKYMLEGWDSGTHVRTSVHIGYTHHSAYRPDQGEVQDELKDATGSQSLAGSAAQWTRTFFIRPSVFPLKKEKILFCSPFTFFPPLTRSLWNRRIRLSVKSIVQLICIGVVSWLLANQQRRSITKFPSFDLAIPPSGCEN